MNMNWQTPPALYHTLDKIVGGFQVDAAATAENSLNPRHYGPGSTYGTDALAVAKWFSPAFCNPPYLKGKAWEQWLDKFVEQKRLGVKIVALLPAKTGTAWWRDYVFNEQCDVLFLTGRVPFELPGRQKPTQPNHDSALVIYGQDTTGSVTWIDWKAKLVKIEGEDPNAHETARMLVVPPGPAVERFHDPRTGATHRLLRSRPGGRSVGGDGSEAGAPVQGASGLQADEVAGVGGPGPSEV